MVGGACVFGGVCRAVVMALWSDLGMDRGLVLRAGPALLGDEALRRRGLGLVWRVV